MHQNVVFRPPIPTILEKFCPRFVRALFHLSFLKEIRSSSFQVNCSIMFSSLIIFQMVTKYVLPLVAKYGKPSLDGIDITVKF